LHASILVCGSAIVCCVQVMQIQKRMAKFVAQVLYHVFTGQRFNVRLEQEQENSGSRAYLDKFPDPRLPMNEACESWSTITSRRHVRVPNHNFNL